MVHAGRHSDQPPGEDGEREMVFVPKVISGEALFILPPSIDIQPEDIASEPLIRGLRAQATEKWASVPIVRDGKPTKRTQQQRVVVPRSRVEDLTAMYMRRMGLISKETREPVYRDLVRFAAEFEVDYVSASTADRTAFLKALAEQTDMYKDAALGQIEHFIREAARYYHGADAEQFNQLFVELGIFGKYVMMREQAKEQIDGV